MSSYLKKNGEVLCYLVNSSCINQLPTQPEKRWHSCTITTTQRVTAGPNDEFRIVTAKRELPFSVSHCHVAVEGWEIDGQVLY